MDVNSEEPICIFYIGIKWICIDFTNAGEVGFIFSMLKFLEYEIPIHSCSPCNSQNRGISLERVVF